MACRPPIRPKSTPYWKGERIITPQARKTFQWASHPSPSRVVVMLSCGRSAVVSFLWRRELCQLKVPLVARARGYLRVSWTMCSF